MKATMDAAGRLVIPKALRLALGFRRGRVLEARAIEGRLELDVRPRRSSEERRLSGSCSESNGHCSRYRMGFVKHHPSIEAWLQMASGRVSVLNDREYLELVNRWRQAFLSEAAGQRRHGIAAELCVSEALPADVYVFNIPGFAEMPRGGRHDRTYAYMVDGLRVIDFEAANAAEAIIAQCDLAFTLYCTHEARGLAHPWFARNDAE